MPITYYVVYVPDYDPEDNADYLVFGNYKQEENANNKAKEYKGAFVVKKTLVFSD